MLRLLAIAVLAFAAPAAASPGASPSAFRVGDGVACKVASPGTLVCEGKRSGSIAIRSTGTPVSSRVQVPVRKTMPLLRSGQTWRRYGIACTVRASKVTCANRAGAVLVLSANRVAVLAAAAVSP